MCAAAGWKHQPLWDQVLGIRRFLPERRTTAITHRNATNRARATAKKIFPRDAYAWLYSLWKSAANQLYVAMLRDEPDARSRRPATAQYATLRPYDNPQSSFRPHSRDYWPDGPCCHADAGLCKFLTPARTCSFAFPALNISSM